MTQDEAVTRASQTVTDLQQKLQKAQTREEKLTDEYRALGFQVHVEGKGRKQLDSLIAEQVGLKAEIESLTGALDVASANLASAKAAVNRVADEAKAQELLSVADAFDGQVHKLAEAGDALVAAATALVKIHGSLSGLGATRPTRQQLDVMTGRAISTMLMQAGLQSQAGTTFLAPGERRRFEDLLQYSGAIRADATARLGEKREAA
jgi:hypothetical protein